MRRLFHHFAQAAHGFGHGGHGGHGHHGRRFGDMGPRGMRKARLLTSQELQLVTLQLLTDKPRYGYEIIKAVEEISSGIYTPSPGMIYPVLTYLEELAYAISQAEGAKKLFHITDEGRAHLEANRSQADDVIEQLKAYGQKMAAFQNQMAQDEMADERWGRNVREKMEFHELRRDLKAALISKLGASPEEKRRVLDVLRRAIDEIRGS